MTQAHPLPARSAGTSLRMLVGSGDRIGLFVLPVLVVGVALNVAFPSWFSVGGPPAVLRAVAIVVLVPGLVVWAWSVFLILRCVPRGELITGGPYRLCKHPLYTGVALLVLPAIGLLFNTWVGIAIGVWLYVGSRRYAPIEETELAAAFGPAWDGYARHVALPWL